jgi:hypothetical protein
MHCPALSNGRPANLFAGLVAGLLFGLLLAATPLAHAQAPSPDKAKELCMGRNSALDERFAGCTAIIDAGFTPALKNLEAIGVKP